MLVPPRSSAGILHPDMRRRRWRCLGQADGGVKHYDVDGACTVPLGMFGQAMFSDTFALSFLAVSVLTKVVVYCHWDH